MNKKYILGLIVVVILVVGFLFLFNNKKEKVVSVSKVKVVTSFYPLYFLASQIGGDKVEVSNITPAGAEPHEYEPTARDMAGVENSNLLVLNGGGLESWGTSIENNLNNDKNKVVTASEGLMTNFIEEEGQKKIDPHVWLSPILFKQMADKIENGLSEADPRNASYYKSNANSLKEQLSKLDEEFKKGLTSCMTNNIITSHSAFGYLAQSYNLKQVSITGLSTEEEPSSREMIEIVKFAKDNNVKYIFFESLVSPKLSETIAKEVGAKTLVLNPIEGLTEDEIKLGEDYFSVMKENLTNLKIALQCTQ
jgi:zinc transport system substrate-binding protein